MIDNYVKRIKNITTKEQADSLVSEMFKNIELDDIDFNDIIYDNVIPKLKELGYDMSYNEETKETNYEKVMKGDY